MHHTESTQRQREKERRENGTEREEDIHTGECQYLVIHTSLPPHANTIFTKRRVQHCGKPNIYYYSS